MAQPERTGGARKVIAATTNTGHSLHPGDEGLVPLEELIRQAAHARPISSVDDLRCDVFEADEELDEFLAFVADSRQASLA